MRLICAFIAVFTLGVSAQTPTASVVIKGQGCFTVTFLRFSPGGGELARGCGFGPIEIFDTANYHKARTFRSEIDHTPELTGFAFSPDGTKIATAQGHSGALIWDAADHGKPVTSQVASFKSFYGVDELYALNTPMRVLEGPSGHDDLAYVSKVAFSPDGKQLLTTHFNGHVKIWNTSTWTLEGEFVVNSDGRLSVLAFSPNGKMLILGDEKGVLHYWNLATNSEIRTLPSPDATGGIVNLEFSPNGKTLVAIYQGKKPANGPSVIWNTTDWSAQTINDYTSAAFSRDGQLLSLGGPDIKLIDPTSRKELRVIDLPRFTKAEVLPNSTNRPDAKDHIPCGVSALAFSPDGASLAVGCFEGTLRILKLTL